MNFRTKQKTFLKPEAHIQDFIGFELYLFLTLLSSKLLYRAYDSVIFVQNVSSKILTIRKPIWGGGGVYCSSS
jgi:hypothetical protein